MESHDKTKSTPLLGEQVLPVIPKDAVIVGMHLNSVVTVVFWRDGDGVLMKTQTTLADETELMHLVETAETAFAAKLETD